MEEKTTAKKVMLSGIQPSGDLHLCLLYTSGSSTFIYCTQKHLK